jgi:hypothetical protein
MTLASDPGKATIDLLNATRAVLERDLALGIVKEQDLRHTIEARKREHKKLADQGLSQRQIAKATGVSKETVARDLGKRPAQNVPRNGTNSATPESIKQRRDEAAKRNSEDTRVYSLSTLIGPSIRALARSPSEAAQDAKDYSASYGGGKLAKETIRRAIDYLKALEVQL